MSLSKFDQRMKGLAPKSPLRVMYPRQGIWRGGEREGREQGEGSELGHRTRREKHASLQIVQKSQLTIPRALVYSAPLGREDLPAKERRGRERREREGRSVNFFLLSHLPSRSRSSAGDLIVDSPDIRPAGYIIGRCETEDVAEDLPCWR